MFSHDKGVKAPVFQCFREYVRADAFIGDGGGDAEFHWLPPVTLATNAMDDLSDRVLLMSSSQCRIALRVQDLFNNARCKSGIVAVPDAETLGGLQ
ncbi:hypothetical protein NJB14197_02850 [Mycobacterium montefiorense]|uniref:Uncharacterized protein n=1 Tax=Mycobacterium montefiorense TaxID=154654 RepID=A0AA37UU88_9MYCO|nr:hypothetical protein MmonteBS_16520 [Mycobacterium montefiorense]GKU35780.1 hypothetical protein NJB14191_31260 [Mycobacterium montefiorense]GKU39744.1 hypothetical protein NJB14192_17350 [Mycobacterium montefiorense]GKU47619.1 hypothetical protein NJB14194_42370 [Mycobacterium montefiorense]GKU48915.1 hypothetical protein NJB14195_01640 [Mycobacterium montefiorense]